MLICVARLNNLATFYNIKEEIIMRIEKEQVDDIKESIKNY